jgi:EH domain-containing protein 1
MGVVDRDGRITGPDAMKFFNMSKLSCADLKQVLDSRYCGFIDFCCAIFFCLIVLQLKVWAIAGSTWQGYLGFNEFISAMQVFLIYPLL